MTPTLFLSALLTVRSWSEKEEFIHNAAQTLWIAANVVWMLGEFFADDGTRPAARIFFYSGLAMLCVFYFAKLGKLFLALLFKHAFNYVP